MNVIKKWRKTISWLLIFALLIGNFSPGWPVIQATDIDQLERLEEVEQGSAWLENELIHSVTDTNQEQAYTLTLHYNRGKADYEGWDLWLWEDGVEGHAVEASGQDEFGLLFELELTPDKEYYYILRKSDWSEKNHNADQRIKITQPTEIWITQGQDGYDNERPDLSAPDETPLDLVIHYERENQDYENFKLYTWGAGETFKMFDHQDDYGINKLISFDSLQDVKNFGFIVYEDVEGSSWDEHKDGGDKKDFDLNQLQLVSNADKYVAHIYVKQQSDTIHYSNPNKEVGTYSTVTIHYNRENQDYDNWDIWLWDTGSEFVDSQSFEYEDEFGRVAEFKVKTGNVFGYIIRKNDWSQKNHSDDQKLLVLGDTEIWVSQGQNGFNAIGPSEGRVELPEDEFEDYISDEEAELQVFVHYYRYAEDYKNWNVWAWGDEAEGAGYPFTSFDEYGKLAKINLKDIGSMTQLGFIVRKGEWSAKDIDKDRLIDLTKASEVDGKKQLHVYLLQGEEMVYYTDEVDKSPALSGVTFTDMNTLKATAPILFEDAEGVTVTNEAGEALSIQSVELSKDKAWLDITLEEEIEIGENYYIAKDGFRDKTVIGYYGLFDSEVFEALYTYEGDDLGATYSKEKTTFKVWAPTAKEVSLKLYETGHEDDFIQEVTMTKGEKGVWEVTVKGDWHKTYYTYKVTVGTNTEEAVDPYARAVGVNGKRAMVVDLEQTNPDSWEKDSNPEFSGNITDAIIYELHLRDLSSASNSGIENVGKYLQLTESGTVNDQGLSTGLDHIKEMGITHLHLLPSFDHRSINEENLDQPQFNWGYDPQHYNVPEGSYSSDPYNGEVRINEFKQMVQSLHENGIRVVMDVVYNHTGATADSDFNKIVPGYYYRQNEDGSFSNGSGCGNETASERAMMRKFMIDSVKYWATEYNINGFRFDLMALHDVETMNAIEEVLHEMDPSIIIYGEGWTGGGSPLPDEEAAYKGNAKQMPNIAFFNDDIRDAVKGNVGNDWEAGYINGNTSDYFYNRLKFGIAGSSYHDQVTGWTFWAENPSQSISYVSAHDNNTLYDKLIGVERKANGDTSIQYLKQLQKQANAIVLTGQGVPFLHAGVEMLRSKNGNHNSYNASDEVNQINWDLKTEHLDVVKYYEGLIQLRKANPAFRMMTSDEVVANLRFDDEVPTGVVSFNITDESAEKLVSNTAVIHNVTDEEQIITLAKEGTWSLVVNGEEAGLKPLDVIEGNQVTVEPHATYVLLLDYDYKEGASTPEEPSEPETPINPEAPEEPSQPEAPINPETPEHPSQPETPMYIVPDVLKDILNVDFISFIEGDGSHGEPLVIKIKKGTQLDALKELFEAFNDYQVKVSKVARSVATYSVTLTKGTENYYLILQVNPSDTDLIHYLETYQVQEEQMESSKHPTTGYGNLGLSLSLGICLIVVGVWIHHHRKIKTSK